MDTLFFYASKLFAVFLTPLGLLLLSGAILLVIFHPWRRAKKKDTAAASPLSAWCCGLSLWVLLYALSCPLVSEAFLALWEFPLSAQPDSTFDAVIVLGGMVIPDAPGASDGTDAAGSGLGDLGPDPALARWPAHLQVNDAMERLIETARLWRSGVAPLVIVSGGSGDLYQPQSREAGMMKALLVGLGVPDQVIISEDRSRNTWENLQNVRDILRQKGLSRVLVVSSALHMRRVEGICRKTFDSVVLSGQSAPVTYALYAADTCKTRYGFPEAVLPSVRSFELSSRTLREITGYLTYAVMGYL